MCSRLLNYTIWMSHRPNLYPTPRHTPRKFNSGRMHGQGTYIWPDIHQCYVGQWKTSKRHGQGRHYFSSRSPNSSAKEYYDGEWKEGVMHGKGRYVDANGDQHEGVWVDGVCPEVDFTHVPECGNFRYCFTVSEIFDGVYIGIAAFLFKHQ